MTDGTCPHCGVGFDRKDSRRTFCYECLPTTGSAKASKAERAAYYYKRNQLARYLETGQHGLCCTPHVRTCPHCEAEFNTIDAKRVFCQGCRPERHPQGSVISARLSAFLRTGVHGRCCTDLPELIECGWCFRPFEPARATAKFCSVECSVSTDKQRASYGHTDRCPVVHMDCSRCRRPVIGWHGRKQCRECEPAPNKCLVSYGECLTCGATITTVVGVRRYCSAQCSPARRRSLSPSLRLQVLERDGWKCHLCGKKIVSRRWRGRPGDPTVDHLVPMSRGGCDSLTNLAAAHHGCNSARNVWGPAQLRLLG